MYKDKETQRKAVKAAVNKHRKGITEGITKQGITPDLPEGITLHRFIDGKRVELTEVPKGFKVLSDGQVWKPTLDITPVVIDDPIRKERAERYLNWYGCNTKDGMMLGK